MEEIRAQMMANQELIVKEEEETSAEQWEKQVNVRVKQGNVTQKVVLSLKNSGKPHRNRAQEKFA